ncbi:MAG: hypothetical protein IJN75_04280 [Clostridia bacterium]|nr:hypothetical protein [Clostridia bacterium]
MNECEKTPQVYIGDIPVDPHIYEEIEVHHNCTVIISRCKKCGKIDISWSKEADDEI